MTAPSRRWISPRECAELLGLSLSGVRKMISRGEILAVHLGRTVRVDRIALEKNFEAQLGKPR